VRGLLSRHGEVEELHTRNSAAFWREVGDVAPFVHDASAAVWRVSVPPASAARVTAHVDRSANAAWYFDGAGGVIWIAVAGAGDGGEEAVRGAVAATGAGGHATLVRGDARLRARVPVFQPQPAALAALSRRVKAQFDPNGVLNPGRMWAGD